MEAWWLEHAPYVGVAAFAFAAGVAFAAWRQLTLETRRRRSQRLRRRLREQFAREAVGPWPAAVPPSERVVVDDDVRALLE